jgi:hypothetical protein
MSIASELEKWLHPEVVRLIGELEARVAELEKILHLERGAKTNPPAQENESNLPS